ncbi:GMC oxidoreductase [Mycena venus]|uniref:GMC oxidoreductase n=1 Tax=Mycena venus TaxID=2733690 RepID=A0A8H7D2K6_9AGAR|nr:GMC oxidoreductase [Mycena venus]
MESPPISEIEAFVSTPFDYIIIGQRWNWGLNNILNHSIISTKIDEIEAEIAVRKSTGVLTELVMQQYTIQLDWLKNKEGTLPHLEFLLFTQGLVKSNPKACYFMMAAGAQHPRSRGSVHISSADPVQEPAINPRYLTEEFDAFSLLAGYRAIEKLSQTPPFTDIIEEQIMPAAKLSDDEVIQYIRQTCISGSHYMGTAAMAHRELGGTQSSRPQIYFPYVLSGVVGSNLKVHGTANLRVADASIIPLPIAAHIQATVYAIGEKV